jgi:SAM-dependent methyltransferase
MNLFDLIQRDPKPQPWSEGETIPWNDPDFSVRMLREHLSQAHDAASRRFRIIDQQVDWIDRALLGGVPSAVLDLGCGPGFYTALLARRGHRCTGIDFSPASIDYARTYAENERLNCIYTLDDIRAADYGAGNRLVMLVYGEFNIFRPADAEAILRKAHAALDDGGTLLLEPFRYAAARELGSKPPEWWTSDGGLFSDKPHLILRENLWDGVGHVAINRYFIVDGATSEVTRHSISTQAYTDDAYRALLERCGFRDVTFTLAAEVSPAQPDSDFVFVSAKRV